MATFEQEKEYRDSLGTQLEQLTAIDADSLVRVDELVTCPQERVQSLS